MTRPADWPSAWGAYETLNEKCRHEHDRSTWQGKRTVRPLRDVETIRDLYLTEGVCVSPRGCYRKPADNSGAPRGIGPATTLLTPRHTEEL